MIQLSAALREAGLSECADKLELSITEGPRNLSADLRVARGKAFILAAAEKVSESINPDMRKLGFRLKTIAGTFK